MEDQTIAKATKQQFIDLRTEGYNLALTSCLQAVPVLTNARAMAHNLGYRNTPNIDVRLAQCHFALSTAYAKVAGATELFDYLNGYNINPVAEEAHVEVDKEPAKASDEAVVSAPVSEGDEVVDDTPAEDNETESDSEVSMGGDDVAVDEDPALSLGDVVTAGGGSDSSEAPAVIEEAVDVSGNVDVPADAA